jgi:cyclase
MLKPRIVPCLLIQGEGLVKTVNFSNPRYIGDPLNAIRIFNEKKADEIIILDIEASKLNKSPNFQLIEKFSLDCRMPICYGGGIKTLPDALRIIEMGVEKIAINSAAYKSPDLINSLAREVGTQSVVASIDVNYIDGKYYLFGNGGQIESGIGLMDHVARVVDLGAGELLINSVHKDGLMNGYDLELSAKIRRELNCPITFLGGAGSLRDVEDLLHVCGVIGVAAGSLFLYKGEYKAVLINYPSQEDKKNLAKHAYLS